MLSLSDTRENGQWNLGKCLNCYDDNGIMQQILLDLEPRRRLFTVSELNSRIRAVLDEQFGEIWVSGEISGVRLASSGHYYFTLKDGDAQVKCACFRMAARYLRFKPADGVAVIARGRLDVYDARGEYQLLVEHLEPQGYGALQFAFEQLKKKLTAEGLFDSGRKRPLPKYPQRIGIVTSPSGAVIQDMLNILLRRFPGLHIRLYPAQVQGEGSVEQVCRGIRWFSDSEWADIIILARGGGSLEDLWTFNEEEVARAIVGSDCPSCPQLDMKPISRSPTLWRTCGPLRRLLPRNLSLEHASRCLNRSRTADACSNSRCDTALVSPASECMSVEWTG